MSKYTTFECSYAVLPDGIFVPNMGNIDKTLVLNKAEKNKITKMTKMEDLFLIEVNGGKHLIVTPIEHVRYMVPIEPSPAAKNGTGSKA